MPARQENARRPATTRRICGGPTPLTVRAHGLTRLSNAGISCSWHEASRGRGRQAASGLCLSDSSTGLMMIEFIDDRDAPLLVSTSIPLNNARPLSPQPPTTGVAAMRAALLVIERRRIDSSLFAQSAPTPALAATALQGRQDGGSGRRWRIRLRFRRCRRPEALCSAKQPRRCLRPGYAEVRRDDFAGQRSSRRRGRSR